MNVATIVTAILIAFAFSFWPVLASYTKASTPWVSTIISLGSGITVSFFAYKQFANNEIPTWTSILILCIGACANGTAMYFYSDKVADKTVNTGDFVTLVVVSMVMITPLFNLLVNGSVPSGKKMIGYACAAVGVYMIAKK